MSGHPTFNQEKLTKRAKRQVGFVLQVCTADLCQSLLCEVLQALLCPPPPLYIQDGPQVAAEFSQTHHALVQTCWHT